MKDFEASGLSRSIETLSEISPGDTLRAAQKFMAGLASAGDQEAAFVYTIDTFTKLTQPQRLTLLDTIQTHLDRNQYPCLAIQANRFIIENVFDRLERELARKQGLIFKTGVHGTAEEITSLMSAIEKIKAGIAQISIEEKTLQISPELSAFIAGLTDNQFARLIHFVKKMRDIKASRNQYHEVVDEAFLAEKLGMKPNAVLGVSVMPNFLKFLRDANPAFTAEMARMDFQELNNLADYIQEVRSQKYRQGAVK